MAEKSEFLNDGKTKELILKEEKIKHFWNKHWSTYASYEFYKQIIREECIKAGKDPDFIFNRIKKKNEEKEEKSFFYVKPSPKPHPVLSSQVVGWRSNPEYSLEIAGKLYISPTKTMYLPGQEPPERFNVMFFG